MPLVHKEQPVRKVDFTGDYPLRVPALTDRLPRPEWQRQMDTWWFDFRTVLMRHKEELELEANSIRNDLDTFQITVNTRFDSLAGVEAGAGLYYIGTVLNVGSATLTVTADAIDLSVTGVSAGTYGSASQVAQITVDAYGRVTGASNVTIPPDALIDLATGVIGILPLANGGTSAALVAVNGGFVYSTATTLAITAALSGIIQGNGAAAPTGVAGTQFGLAYFPTTTTVGTTGAGTATTVLHGNAVGAPTWSAISLSVDVSGVLPVPNGGTGAATLTGIVQGNAALAMTAITGTANYLPKWSATAPYLTATSKVFDNGTDVGINTITPVTELHVASTSSADPRGIMSAQYSTDAVGARFHFRKARGTEALPTTIVTADVLGRIRFSGYDGANYLQMGSIDVGSSGTVAATRVPTYMAFSVGTDAAPSVLTERMRIINSGFVGIGQTVPITLLHLAQAAGAAITMERITASGVIGDTLGQFQWYNGATRTVIAGGYADGATDSGMFEVWTKATGVGIAQRLTVKSSGFVGIGIVAPTSRLHVPWITGDAVATATFGSTNSNNNQIAIQANSFSSVAVNATSSTSFGLQASSNTAVAGAFVRNDNTAVGNVVYDAASIRSTTTGTPAASFGTGLKFLGATALNSTRDMARIQSIWTDATDATRTSALQFQTVDTAAALATGLTIAGNGQVMCGRDITLAASGAFQVIGTGSAIGSGAAINITSNVTQVSVISAFSGTMRLVGTGAFQSVRGINMVVANRSTAATNAVRATFSSARNDTAGSRAVALTGGSFDAMSDSTAGTVATVTGVESTFYNNTAGQTFTSAYGLRVLDITNAGTITNTFGVWVGDITTGTQPNVPYSFYASDANAFNNFAGNTAIGGSLSVGNSVFTTAAGVINAVTGYRVASAVAAVGTYLAGNGTNFVPAAFPGGFTGFGNPATPSVQLTVTNGVATTAMRSDAVLALDQSIAPTWTGFHTHLVTALGVTPNDATGVLLANTTAAALGAVQISPALRWRGFDWETTGGTSQSLDTRAYLHPVQDTSNRGYLRFQSSRNGAAYQDNFWIDTRPTVAVVVVSSLWGLAHYSNGDPESANTEFVRLTKAGSGDVTFNIGASGTGTHRGMAWLLGGGGVLSMLSTGQLRIGDNSAAATSARFQIGAGTSLIAPINLTSGVNLTSPIAGSMEYDGNLWFTKSNAVILGIGGSITSSTTQTGNVALTETDLFSVSIAAGTGTLDGSVIDFTSAGTFATSLSADKRIRCYWAGVLIFDSGNLNITVTSDWAIYGSVIRVDATNFKAVVTLNTSSASLSAYADYSTGASTWANANTLKLTGQGTNGSDVVGEMWKVNYQT